MNIEKIQVNGYYVWVDKDAEIKGDNCWTNKGLLKNLTSNGGIFFNFPFQDYSETYYDLSNVNKIIAASPELNLDVPTYVEWLANNYGEEVKEQYIDSKLTFDERVYLYGGVIEGFKKGYQTAERELRKQLITEVMNEDAKDGLYDEYEQISQDNPVTRGSTALVKKSQNEKEPQPTWDDVRKAFKLFFNNNMLSTEEIIEQLKQEKK